MKLLRDTVRLDGETETVNATELRAHLGDVLTQASLGKAYTVKHKGKTVCHIVPPGEAQLTVEIGPDGEVPDWMRSEAKNA